ncbi:MAG: STAS domain-containing protein [Saprospiraceae bacterium]
MKYALDKQDKYAVLKLEEDNLNSMIAPDLKSEFVFLYNEGVRNLILDLSLCKFVDSSGLSSILVADRLWKNLGSFILTGIEHDSVKKLIEISRLDTVLTLIPTLEEAIEYVHMEEIERELNADVDVEDNGTGG